MNFSDYKYKVHKSDFNVNEIINLKLDGGDFYYYYLRKKGMKTTEVIENLSTMYDIDLRNITYAGLKDEDGITSQYISILKKKIESTSHVFDSEKEYSLIFLGSSSEALRIGALQGNSFNIILRNLSEEDACSLKLHENEYFSIINYFDTQRFGMPHKEKCTHLIGKAILDNDYSKALLYMLKTGNISEEDFFKWKGNESDYFYTLDIRKINFFLSSWDSYIWNESINSEVSKYHADYVEKRKDGITYNFAKLCKDDVEKMSLLPIVWHRMNENHEIIEKNSFRKGIVEVFFKFLGVHDDMVFLGRNCVEFEFILPAGCYATNVIDQICFLVSLLK